MFSAGGVAVGIRVVLRVAVGMTSTSACSVDVAKTGCVGGGVTGTCTACIGADAAFCGVGVLYSPHNEGVCLQDESRRERREKNKKVFFSIVF